jgi:hypothetical protein
MVLVTGHFAGYHMENAAALVLGEHLGFGREWPVIPMGTGGDSLTWKLTPVERWCDEHAAGRAVAWVGRRPRLGRGGVGEAAGADTPCANKG